MEKLRINIVLPFFTNRPNGGVKIMYEYANRLHLRGHSVTVLHSIQRPYRRIKSPVWWKQLNYRLKGTSRPSWFPLHKGIRSVIVPDITENHVPDADIIMSTWWEMTYMIADLPPSKGKKFNLVQGYETWKGHTDLVHGSYKLPVQNLAIARYLQQLVKKYSGVEPLHISNAIDLEKFQLRTAPEQRTPFSVLMLYSEEAVKGTSFGLAALTELKKVFPQFSAHLFGVYKKPSLPSWINYTQRPADLAGLMNRHAVFLSPSLGEGWALPPAEAMACGCALVCTDIGGHADYALDGETALLAKPEDVRSLAEKLGKVLSNEALRLKLAHRGHDFITTQFSWERSVGQLEDCFYRSL